MWIGLTFFLSVWTLVSKEILLEAKKVGDTIIKNFLLLKLKFFEFLNFILIEVLHIQKSGQVIWVRLSELSRGSQNPGKEY